MKPDRLQHWLLLSAALLFLTACAPAGLINSLTPSGAYTLQDNLSYGPENRHRLDVYAPKEPAAGNPVAVFFYGGTWSKGERNDYEFVGHALSRRGILVVIADYRVYPDVHFPAFVEDGARAVDWTFRNIQDLGGNPDLIFVMGHSAGAHIAALLATDPAYLERFHRHPEDLGGLIGLAGPYDFLPLESDRLRRIFSEDAETQRRSQPVEHVHSRMPPTLLLHGSADERVLPENAHSFARAIRDAGSKVEHIEYEGQGHTRILASVSHLLRFLGRTTTDLERFIIETSQDSDEPKRARSY